jgi:hypothetical protein
MICANCHREIHNPHSTSENLNRLIQLHNVKTELKKETSKRNRKSKYKFTLEEVEARRLECTSWQEVANFYNMSLATLKRHRQELKNSF